MAPVEAAPVELSRPTTVPRDLIHDAGITGHHNSRKHHQAHRQFDQGFLAKARSFWKTTRAVRAGDYRTGEEGANDAGQQSGSQGDAPTPTSSEASPPPGATKSAEVVDHSNA